MTVDLSEALESARLARGLLQAHYQFRNEVGALMLRLVEQQDPTGFVLLEFVRDLNARTGELYVGEESER